MTDTPESLMFAVLEGNLQLLAEKERLERDQQRLQEIDRRKTELLARVSHDLRTPLNSIIGFSELLLGDSSARLNPRHAEFIQAIHRNGHALLTLINDLLDLAGIESGQLALRRERLPLETLLDDVRAATEPQLAKHQLRVAWPTAAALYGRSALCDRRRMAQALINLVDNARKFTPAGGAVTITAEASDRQAVFAVTDTGAGIPEGDRERIFRSFFQRDDAARQRGAGIGLGLAIVRGIVDLHGGRVELDSVVGRGSTFRIILPQGAP